MKITILPEKREIPVSVGENLLDALRRNKIDIPNPCNGAGTCGQCRVRFEQGAPLPNDGDHSFFQPEEIEGGWRLSCLHKVEGEAAIYLAPQAGKLDAKMQIDSPLEQREIDPGVRAYFLQLSSPRRDDQRADVLRLLEGLGQELTIPLLVLKELPTILRDNGFSLTVVEAENEILDLLPNDHSQEIYGVAIDVGTSTLAGYLFDLANGKQLAVAAAQNPQAEFGTDVISRIHHVQERGKDGLGALQRLVLNAVNELIGKMARKEGIEVSRLYKATVVGNPTMIHLLLGINPSAIGQSPYVPVFCSGFSLPASEINLSISPLANVDILPAISAYVGADILAGMLTVNMGGKASIELLLDIGTNGEIVLAVGDKLFVCSTAAGPAFEGGSISQGMSALDGALDRVQIQDHELTCSVIGSKNAIGICGSGLLDAVAVLRRIGLIDASGRLRKTEHPLSSRIEEKGSKTRFLLANEKVPVYLAQRDIREFQLAKGAIRSGIEILMEQADVRKEELERVYIGGAFGSSLRAESLLRVGLLPPIPPDRIVSIGNCAGQGAKLALLDQKSNQKLEKLIEQTEYVELSSSNAFNQLFVKHMHFP